MNITICAPKSLFPDENLVRECKTFAEESGSNIIITDDPAKAVADADVIYTDVWCSMGEEEKAKERVALLTPYQVNAALMAAAKPHTVFMHCLPAVKGNEVTEDVFEKHQKIVFVEAENRMHTIKAVMVATIAGA
jgi:ornithine carbamoyltransferase